VENYLPKQIACWRYVRAQLWAKPITAPTVSIGAGPRLCLWGWFFDHPPGGHEIRAVDVLDWSHVTQLAASLALEHDILAGQKPRVENGVYFPRDFVPPQCANVPGIVGFDLASIKEPSWILIPFFFGHLLDRDGKISPDQMPILGTQLRALAAAGHVLIVVDKAAGTGGTNWFWADLVQRVLGEQVPTEIPTFDFAAHAAEFAACYADTSTGAYRVNTTRASGFWFTQKNPTPHWIT
jgi:hypothetical protein